MTPTKTYTLKGMDCAHCAQTLEQGIGRLDGVQNARVDFMANRLYIEGDITLDVLRQRAQSLGEYDVLDANTPQPTPPSAFSGGVLGFFAYLLREHATRLALIGGALTVLTAIGAGLGLPSMFATPLYIVATSIAAYPIARSGLTNLWLNRTFNINMLMTVAVVGALIINETLEAAVVIFLYAIGEALEGFTADRARQSIRALAELAPANALRLLANGNTETVPVEALAIGDLIRVLPAERLPMDGIITEGHSSLNQAPITGESLPVPKSPNDEVYAGSINGDGALIVQVTHLAADNTLSRIIQLVEQAQSVRAPSQRRIDEFAAIYTPAMMLIALLVATVPPLFFGAPFFEPATGGHGWLYRALAILMIACPCALVISTPVAVVSAITNAARHGVLIKGGLHLEMLGRIRALAFDKTGTLTRGEPAVTSYRALSCTTPDGCATCDDMLHAAAAIEQQSTHPLARAIVGAAHPTQIHSAQQVTNLAGQGIQGVVDGQRVTIGSHRLFEQQFPHTPALCAQVEALEANGQTAMLVAQNDSITGVIGVADTVRPQSAAVVAALKATGIHTAMLTGDNATVAAAIGAQVGVDSIHAELLPQHKTERVQALMAQFGKVGMVGDGVNDTPALAAATVGIAMGGAGSAQAIETADITLMADDLSQLPFALRLSQFTTRLISQNIAFSVGIKLLFVGLAIAGMTSLWLAIFADVGMLVLVTLNGMRPLRFA